MWALTGLGEVPIVVPVHLSQYTTLKLSWAWAGLLIYVSYRGSTVDLWGVYHRDGVVDA